MYYIIVLPSHLLLKCMLTCNMYSRCYWVKSCDSKNVSFGSGRPATEWQHGYVHQVKLGPAWRLLQPSQSSRLPEPAPPPQPSHGTSHLLQEHAASHEEGTKPLSGTALFLPKHRWVERSVEKRRRNKTTNGTEIWSFQFSRGVKSKS